MVSSPLTSATCPICYTHAYTPFFELPDVPVQDGLLWNSKAAACHAPTGQIKLAVCSHCGYVGNLHFEPAKIRYDQEYSFSLHFSPTYQSFVHELAVSLITKFQLTNQAVLEIGCGQGDFLRLLCELGCRCGVGIDPTVTAHCEVIGASHLAFHQERFTEQSVLPAVKFICCRHLLDQISNPRTFVELVRRKLRQQHDIVLYWEVPNAATIFGALAIRNIMYEKSSWFTVHSLTTLFERAGFQVLAVKPCFEDNQYLGIEVAPLPDRALRASQGVQPPSLDRQMLAQFIQSVMAFGDNYKQTIDRWRQQVAAIQAAGQRAIAWGAGAGAITFFNGLKIKEEIPYVIDINPKRQGKFLPLTGQQVVPPAFLREYRPDVIIITNATYTAEIKQQVGAMDIQCEFMVV